ncbi:MAG: sigma-54 dependent transcriptional regulator [Candidatus Acidiferrum sp.]
MAATATAGVIRSRSRILVASADPEFRKRVMADPAYAGVFSEEAIGGAHALAKLMQSPCDGVLLDRNLPDLDAQEVAEEIRKQYPRIAVELVDSRAAIVEAPKSAISEASESREPDDLQRVTTPLADEPDSFSPEESRPSTESLPGMVGSSRAMEQVYRLVRMVANRDTAVLVSGETGTGKELVAGAIHQLSRRAKGPFVVVNCAAIPEALLESELFGYARGAFTGAVQSRLGRIHVAQGGTLFLDEVGDLPLSMQAKLLRFLQNGEVQRLGSSDVYRVDVRVVCATNVRLLELARARQFRLDLYYRLAVFPIVIPPLRERPEDIRALAEHFLATLSADGRMRAKYLSAQALNYLEKAAWAGNVRELQHAIERAFILVGNDAKVCIEHFQAFGESTQLREI